MNNAYAIEMIERNIAPRLLQLAEKYPILALCGPRQSGKSTLLKHLFPQHEYVNLEDPRIREFASTDPVSFLEKYGGHTILDEVQNVPELFSYLQVRVDEKKVMGDYILSGSSQFQLQEQITQSLAGRVSILNLLPLTFSELKQSGFAEQVEKSALELAVRGFYPALFDRDISSQDYFADYLHTYVERDVRSLVNVKDLKLFQTFLRLCAGRVGSIINYTSIGNDVGVSRETVKNWLHVLESSFISFELQPFYKNFNKRMIKSPKLYFHDVGLLCYLLGVSEESIAQHPMRGMVFENFIISEFMKAAYNQHATPRLYFYRDSSGLEVDLVQEENSLLRGMEIKSAQVFSKSFIGALGKWKAIVGQDFAAGEVVYGGDLDFVAEEFKVMSWESLFENLSASAEG